MTVLPSPPRHWSARAEVARSMALLPVSDREGRAACTSRLAECCAAGRADRNLPAVLHRSGVVAAAAYLSRAAVRLEEGRRLLDALAVRATDGADGDGSPLREEMTKAFLRDRALQIELACEGRSSPARSLMQDVTAAGHPSGQDSSEHPDVLIRKLLHADDSGTTLRYTASEVDAVFFQANEVDTEVVHSLVRSSSAAPAEVHLADEDYYISAERPSIATRIADATAADRGAADRIVALPGGLRAFRHLAESAPQTGRRNDLFETEIARSIANIAAGTTSLARAATQAADEGLVSLLSRWADDDSRHVARGHLQVESYRALSNLSQALQPASSQRHMYVNGLLPLQPPGRGRIAPNAADRWDTDVVFVHGLRGGPLMTWRCGRVQLSASGGMAPADEGAPFASAPGLSAGAGTAPTVPTGGGAPDPKRAINVWPRDWLAEEAGNCRVLSVGHDAGVLRDGLGRSMIGPTLSSRAEDIRGALQKSRIGEDGRGVVFVTHSYGGLLVKEALLQDAELMGRTRGVVFFGVPHFGSPVAGSWSGQTQFVVSQAVRELFPAADARAALHQLNAAFIEAVEDRKLAGHRMEVVSFGEGKLLKLEVGARRGQASILLDIVPRESADPLTGQFYLIHDADHVQLSKPPRREDFRYRIVTAIARGGRGAPGKGGG